MNGFQLNKIKEKYNTDFENSCAVRLWQRLNGACLPVTIDQTLSDVRVCCPSPVNWVMDGRSSSPLTTATSHETLPTQKGLSSACF